MMNLYGSTSTLRHSLVHRQLKVDPTTGRMEGVAKPGERPPKPLAADEATAFCRAVQGVAAAVIEGALSLRQRDQLTWLLDQLTTHHGQRVLGGIAVHGVVPTVVADAASVSPEEVAIDTGHLKARAKAASPQATHFDLILHLPDGRILAGALEDAREGPLTLKVDSPPDWLRWA